MVTRDVKQLEKFIKSLEEVEAAISALSEVGYREPFLAACMADVLRIKSAAKMVKAKAYADGS